MVFLLREDGALDRGVVVVDGWWPAKAAADAADSGLG